MNGLIRFASLLAISAVAAAQSNTGNSVSPVSAPTSGPLIIRTAVGDVQGIASVNGQVFLGIPYAAAPVGRLRFSPPETPALWEGVYDASAAGAACPQPKPLFGTTPRMSEDCLNLSVNAPAGTRSSSRLPVMVWIHGGGFTTGSNSQGDASVFAARQRVVVVSINYRLGALGFLASPLFAQGRGNFGLLDQQAALRWIQRNIRAFGGDPAKVTLAGESSGAGSACTHLALPGSRGLFHGAIMESGPCISGDALTSRAEAEAGAIAMAADFGCTTGDVAECLRGQPLARLLSAKSHRRGNNGADGWAPMIGGDVMPQAPRDVFRDGRAAKVPVLAGSNLDEGRMFSNMLTFMGALGPSSNFEKTLSLGLEDRWIAPTVAEYAGAMKTSRGVALADIVTDSHFACPLLTLHRLLGPATPFYAYEFHDPKAPTKIPQAPGAPSQSSFHASEIVYIFQTPSDIADPKAFDEGQRALSDRMQDYWGAFVRTGRPDVAKAPVWREFDGQHPQMLSTIAGVSSSNFAERHHCAFWASQGI